MIKEMELHGVRNMLTRMQLSSDLANVNDAKTLAHGYSSESSQRELSNEY